MQYTQNKIEPFGTHIVQLGDLPAFGVSRPYTGHSFFDNLEEAVVELERVASRDLAGYKRECPGKNFARTRLRWVAEYRRNS